MSNNIARELKERADDFDQYLQKLLQELPINSELQEAISYSLLAGGKRIRPILTVLTCKLLQGDKRAARRFGAALEFIHTYSLIHDDLPCMDDDDIRRGQKSNHLVFGEGMAVLAGDALQTLAFKLTASINIAAEKRCQLTELLADAAGPEGMVAGQVMDLAAEEKDLSIEELREIHAAKTGELFRASILGGALCSECSQREWEALERYARHIGLTFQIVDDILDVVGDEETLGKEVGQDREKEKSTYPSILGLEESRKQAREAALAAKKSLAVFSGEAADLLHQLADFVLERQH